MRWGHQSLFCLSVQGPQLAALSTGELCPLACRKLAKLFTLIYAHYQIPPIAKTNASVLFCRKLHGRLHGPLHTRHSLLQWRTHTHTHSHDGANCRSLLGLPNSPLVFFPAGQIWVNPLSDSLFNCFYTIYPL